MQRGRQRLGRNMVVGLADEVQVMGFRRATGEGSKVNWSFGLRYSAALESAPKKELDLVVLDSAPVLG